MPINYPDNVKHNNASFPIISASDKTVQGWYHVADTTERDALPAAKRLEGAVVVVGSTVYAYTSSDLGDTAWQTSGNWQNLGATGGSPLADTNQTLQGDRTVDDADAGHNFSVLLNDGGKKSEFYMQPGTPSLFTVTNDGATILQQLDVQVCHRPHAPPPFAHHLATLGD